MTKNFSALVKYHARDLKPFCMPSKIHRKKTTLWLTAAYLLKIKEKEIILKVAQEKDTSTHEDTQN